MESKDRSHQEPIRPPPLLLDPANLEAAPDADDQQHVLSAQGTPTPTSSSSATLPAAVPQGRARSMTQSSPSTQPAAQGRNRSATVANPPKSAPPGGAPPEREKRKRSRVTPEQLAHLERLFAMDRSPTAAKRKEISEILGMQERQTQIWFQNRRAKAKTLEGKGKSGYTGSPPGVDSPPGTPSDFNPALEGDLQALVHEHDPVTFIPCSDLTIGSWRRISTSPNQYDLLAYISNVKRCLTWFIHSNGYGFKMEIPFDSITNTTFNGVSASQGLVSVYLSRPPLFFLESVSSPSPGLPLTKVWKPCPDWTEGHQASKVFRHDLIGAIVPLLNALKILPRTSAPSSTMAHASAPYPSSSSDTISPMHIPQPPLAALDPPPSFPLSAGSHSHLTHDRKRSFSGPPAMTQSQPPDSASFAMLPTPATSTDTPTPYSAAAPFSERGTPLGFNTDFSYRSYSSLQQQQPSSSTSHHSQSSSLTDFSTVPISHAASARSFSSPVGASPYSYDAAMSMLQGGSGDRFPPSSETSLNQFGGSSSSPMLLTSAFDPSTLRQQGTSTTESSGMDMETSVAYAADVAQPDAFQNSLDLAGQP